MTKNKCEKCGKILSTNRARLCKSCCKEGRLNPQYKGVHYKENFCIECGCEISISTRYKGKRCLSCSKKGELNPQSGKVPWNYSEDTPEKTRIRGSIEYRLWREAVFARDNWTCQKCSSRGGVIHAHHIKTFSDYPELRTSIENGITLCKKCHKIHHARSHE